ncbi:hypothetical protein BDZ97DRAFT_1442699 [Flammula alnicola]|nr:hypothetical protein BDZ97DRAFT_1442699 [Flammula alnicola]
MDVVSRHLSSNFPPSKTDVSSIKHSIILNDRKLLKIQQEIDEHHAELLKLRQRSNELQIRKQSYQGILSPIRRLPISILSEIFRVTINASMSDDPWLNLKLMGVCQLWRNTFLNTPVLWTALVLPKSIPTEKVRDVVQGAMQYIRRSRALPLSISLDALQVSRQDAADLFSCILAKQRWKDVTLSGAFVEFFLAATKPLENSPFKVLRSLKIRESPTYQTNYLRGNYSLQLTDLPMLSSLSLETASHVNIAALYVPFSQLKCLSLTALSNTGDYLEILRACPNLEECSFAIHPCGKLYCGTLINTENPPPNVFCPNLRRLTLGSAEYLISLLLFMMAPRLEDFTLSSTFQQLEEDTIAVDMGLDQELLFF